MPDDIDELWFRFAPSKFMAGIRGLNSNEVKAYICLLCRIYEQGGPIENDIEILSTACEMRPSSFEKALARLIRLRKLTEQDGYLSNDFAEQELSRRASKSEKARRAGEKSAEKRKQNQRLRPTDVQQTCNHKEEEREKEKESPLTPQGGQATPPDPVSQPVAAQAPELDLGDAPKPTPTKRARRSLFPEDWSPDPDLLGWAEEQGFSKAQAFDLARRCVDHHRAKGTMFADHRAAYRKWVSNEIRFRQDRQTPSGSTPRQPAYLAAAARPMTAEQRRRRWEIEQEEQRKQRDYGDYWERIRAEGAAKMQARLDAKAAEAAEHAEIVAREIAEMRERGELEPERRAS